MFINLGEGPSYAEICEIYRGSSKKMCYLIKLILIKQIKTYHKSNQILKILRNHKKKTLQNSKNVETNFSMLYQILSKQENLTSQQYPNLMSEIRKK